MTQNNQGFCVINQMEFSFAFDMLLHNDAKQLWQELCQINESISNEDAEKWFLKNFGR